MCDLRQKMGVRSYDIFTSPAVAAAAVGTATGLAKGELHSIDLTTGFFAGPAMIAAATWMGKSTLI